MGVYIPHVDNNGEKRERPNYAKMIANKENSQKIDEKKDAEPVFEAPAKAEPMEMEAQKERMELKGLVHPSMMPAPKEDLDISTYPQNT
eukprot:TRINITY_DN859_c0_g2_i4.p1 TRINITY_DN859_c0_g2~~TRINITY_DN859_c0_g2_i4.p1  ORF type:complete len:102 (-),score=28.66 TRINITY_DN859_c0_g2_i4:242-508(-)